MGGRRRRCGRGGGCWFPLCGCIRRGGRWLRAEVVISREKDRREGWKFIRRSIGSWSSLTAALCTTPELLTTMSRPPRDWRHVATARSQSSLLVASPVKLTATSFEPDDSLRALATRLPFSGWISKMSTRAPSATNLRAMPSPKPRPAPVMIAFLFSSRPE